MEEKERLTLYGTTSCSTCAFCRKHGAAMTPKQMARKHCLKKQCHYLLKHDHPYWDEREKAKQIRKDRKDRMNAAYEEAIRR